MSTHHVSGFIPGKRLVFALVAASITLSACGNSTDSAEVQDADSFALQPGTERKAVEGAVKPVTDVAVESAGTLQQAFPVRREIIYTATLAVEVKRAAVEANTLRKVVLEQGGYVLSDERSETSVRMQLRVLPSRFDALLKSLEKIGKVRNQSVNASDVTADMVDIEARLNSAKVSRGRLQELLRGASKVEDIIRIEGELQQRESLVEQMQGQLNVLKNQVGFATITVDFFEARTAISLDDDNPSPTQGLRNGWTALQNTVNAFILVLATLLPFLVVILPAILLLRWSWRRTSQWRATRRTAREASKSASRRFFTPTAFPSEATISGSHVPDNLTAERSQVNSIIEP